MPRKSGQSRLAGGKKPAGKVLIFQKKPHRDSHFSLWGQRMRAKRGLARLGPLRCYQKGLRVRTLKGQLRLRSKANTRYVIVSASYLVSKGKMRKTEEFSEEFSVLSENSSPAPHCSSLDLIGQFRLGQPLMILSPGMRILVWVLICSSLDLIGQFRLGESLMILTPRMRILILVLISSSLDLIGQFRLGEALLILTARMRFHILVLSCSSLDLNGQFCLDEALLVLTARMRFLILVLSCSSLNLISQFWLGEALLVLTARMRFLFLVLSCSSLVSFGLICPH